VSGAQEMRSRKTARSGQDAYRKEDTSLSPVPPKRKKGNSGHYLHPKGGPPREGEGKTGPIRTPCKLDRGGLRECAGKAWVLLATEGKSSRKGTQSVLSSLGDNGAAGPGRRGGTGEKRESPTAGLPAVEVQQGATGRHVRGEERRARGTEGRSGIRSPGHIFDF